MISTATLKTIETNFHVTFVEAHCHVERRDLSQDGSTPTGEVFFSGGIPNGDLGARLTVAVTMVTEIAVKLTSSCGDEPVLQIAHMNMKPLSTELQKNIFTGGQLPVHHTRENNALEND
ncbi:hypothetical protein J6590_077651 [Homalodisca vitripennis]|nr:hypothetical protein J6590_077651 [Homalodisca vitripennis]